jgi:hypothetical protein
MLKDLGRRWGAVARRIALSAAAAAAFGFGVFGLSSEVSSQSVDIEQIFWCDEAIGPMGDQTPEECLEARQMVLTACTSCHTFAPVVLSQYTESEWESFMARHAERVPELSQEQLDQLTEFLKVRYNPDNPQPDLPPALREYTLPPA